MSQRTEPCSCPECGGPSIATVYQWPGEQPHARPQPCESCQAIHGRMIAEVRALLARYPGMDTRTRNCLQRSGAEIGGARGLLAATDDQILGLRMVGLKTLAELRRFIPRPGRASPVSPDVFWSQCRDVFSLVGG